MQSVVTIEKLVFGGAGLARTADGVMLVADALGGERVRIEPTGKRGGVVTARTVELLSPSPDRRAPPCPVAGVCGGCDWQHIVYKAQLSAKAAIFDDCMRRIGRIRELPGVEIFSADEFGYRHRVQIKIDTRGKAGFFAKRTNEVVPIDRCLLLVDPLNRLLAALPGRLATSPSPIPNLMAIAGDGGEVASFPRIDGLTVESVTISAGTARFDIAGNSFFQSNKPLLEPLGNWARPHAGGDRFIDLYGGTGFFSVMLADRFAEGLLIESVGAQVEAARKNFVLNSIHNVKAEEGTAERLSSLAGSKPVSCLIVDPPRPGLTRTVRESIATLKPAMALYVSCNPSTQARDVGFLVHKAGYEIARTAIFDLYPNTHHMESVMILTRKNNKG
jgi:23S rRNA (uracil1939-C5)-methyltransferase